MKHSTKGAMLSGLVFPGAGQIAQKRYARGMFFIVAVLAAAVAMVVAAMRQAVAILDQIIGDGGDIDFVAIADAAIRVSADRGGSVYALALLAIIVAWGASVADAWLTGRKMDAAATANPPPPLSPSGGSGQATGNETPHQGTTTPRRAQPEG